MLILIIAMLMILFSMQFSLAETPDNRFSIGSRIAGAEKDTDEGYITIVSDPIRISDLNYPETPDSRDLANFLDRIVITGAEQDANGYYAIIPGVPYTIQMFFSEKTNGRQFDVSEQNNVLTYQFPGGFSTLETSGSFSMPGDYGDVTVYYVISGNTLTVTFDPKSPGYQNFINAENTQFEIHATGLIYDKEIIFSTEVTGEFTFDDSREVSVQKIGSYDGDLNRIKFTIQANSKGNNTNVHIGDIISGTALTYDPDTLTVSSNKSNPVDYTADTRAGETFGLTLPSMVHGETVTIEYYADVDLTGVTGIGNGNYGTLEQTGNSVKISSQDDWPGHEVTIDAGDFVNKIKLSNVRKTASSQFIRDGKTYITWTIVLNENANLSLAGKTVTDIIDASSQQIMQYSGNGLHIEKYEKNGTSAGSSDVEWGTGGLTASNGGSTWTYTIPASDEGHNYKYVITYETKVDSDLFLTTTTVNNSAHDEYDTAYGGANVGTTGQEVDADKSVKHTQVDAANKTAETEWMITFNVPPAGLDSAVINDALPSILDPETNRWFYDALKANSVHVEEGDLREGESFSVDTTSQDHHVIITFTKNNGESGLTGTGLLRTIRVYLTTTADPGWLEFAERESRARTHVNNAVVTLNGQDIHVSESVIYNTSELDLEKVLFKTCSTNTDPALPIYVYQIVLSGVNDGTFLNGPITITDMYNSDYLTFKLVYDNTDEWHDVRTPNGHVYGNNQYNKYGMLYPGPSVVHQTEEGKIIFKIDKESLPRPDVGNYYPYYVIYYALQIKDAETLERMKAEALHTPGLKVSLNNTASSNDFGTNTITTDYTIHALEKTELSEGYNSETGTYDIQFNLEVNKEALKIGDKDTITVKDTVSNLSFDYTSIKINPQLEGDVLNRIGNSILFTLHNKTHYTITYTARLVGLQGDTVAWNNKAEVFGYMTENSGDSKLESSGSGSFSTYRMNVMKYAQGNMNEGLQATFELLEARVKDADGKDIPHTWSKVLKFTTGSTGVYKISTVSRNGVEASLRPYSCHRDGKESFGTDENYGWRYRLVEIEPPPGFIRTNTVYEFGISDIPSYADPYNYLNDDTVTVVNQPIGEIEIEIPGNKVLKGRKLKDQEFAFSLKPEQTIKDLWGDDYPGGFSGSLTVRNDVNGHFSFPLSFTYEDYLAAVKKGFIDENQRAKFYYVIKEELPEGAADYTWKGVTYDRAQFLVLVKLYVDGDGLKTQISAYSYDGNGIDDEL